MHVVGAVSCQGQKKKEHCGCAVSGIQGIKFCLVVLNSNHNLIHCRFTFSLLNTKLVNSQLSGSHSFCTAKLFANLSFAEDFSNDSHGAPNHCITSSSPFEFDQSLICLIKFHPLGLELTTCFVKSSVSILHLPFSPVQFRLCLR